MQEIKVFLPQAKGRNKTTARGFWLDGGRTYYDYVKPVSLPFVSAQAIPAEVKRLRVKHNQLAMFYITLDAEGDKASAFIQSEGGKVEALPRKASVFVLGRRAVRAYVKKFLQSFGGCTVYDIGRGYYEVEGWTK